MYKYTKEDYKNKLLVVQKETIIKALERTKGDLKKAHKLLCPNNTPFVYESFFKVLHRHDINYSSYRNAKVLD